MRWVGRVLRTETARVVALMLGLLALAAVVGGPHLTASPSHSTLSLPWWFFAAFFALTESVVMHIQVRREAQSLSVSELPLVVGLFFADPASLLLGRLLGSLVVFVMRRKSSYLKSLFNLALVCAETCVALAVFRATADPTGVSLREWVAAFAAALVANALGALALSMVIAVYEGGLRPTRLVLDAVTGQPMTPLVVTLALVCVISLTADPSSGWLLVAAAGILLLCYRGYAALSDRHLNLERLYHFSQAVTSSPQTESVLRCVLSEAQDLLSSEYAALTFPGPANRASTVTVTVDAGGELHHDEVEIDVAGAWLRDEIMEKGRSCVLPRSTKDPQLRAWLEARGRRDAVVVPLRGDIGPIGLLVVGDRLGEVRSFDHDDVLLLETLANQASVALQKGELIEQLQHDALHDSLTRLPNRAHLQRRLVECLTQVESKAAPGLSVMILDLNGFKDVNDTLGHHHGDKVLVEVAQRLLAAVEGDGFVARLGGDEFAVLVPDQGTSDMARSVAERILFSLEEPIAIGDLQVEVGASVGIALSPQHGNDATLLLKRADMAMYDAKSSGWGMRFYEADIDTTSARRLSMVSELRAAIATGGISVHAQPQADAASGQVVSVEALARWEDPKLGSVSPDEFIPVAERSGLIKPLTLTLLDTSLAAVATWRTLGLEIGIAVNLSARSLLDMGLVADVRALLNKHRVPPELLVLEVTESAVMADPTRAIALLTKLKAMGVKLSVDDFGTGYSSLSYLKRLPVHEVKIDRSFVTNLTEASEDYAIVRSIVDLGRNLGLEIVAEGVEDQTTWDILRDLGCTRIQGWQLARPMAIADASVWLVEQAASRTASRAVIRVA
jgi:diguanylate cyclase (GGDEF)-like protein